MKPEIKAAWVEALRSGKYEQAHYALKNTKGHCCLGVLCEIQSDEIKEKFQIVVEPDKIVFHVIHSDEETGERMEELDTGYFSCEFSEYIELSDENQGYLAHMNDHEGFSFEDIANYIEQKI